MKKITKTIDPRMPPVPYAKDTECAANADCATCLDMDMPPPDTDSGIGEQTAAVKVRDLDAIAHEMAAAQKELDALQAEKTCVMKDYGRRINGLESRVSELASEYRTAEQRVEYDYDLGVANIYSTRTGELLETRPLAPCESQLALNLPEKSPCADPTDTPLGEALDQGADDGGTF